MQLLKILEQWINTYQLMMFLINITKNLLKLSYFLKNVNATEDLDEKASTQPEVNQDQDEVSTADPEGTEYLDSDSSFLPEVTEYHEVLSAGAKY